MKGKHERRDSSSRCLFDRPQHSSFHWAEMTSKVIAVPGNLPTPWQLWNHARSLSSASSRGPNFIHSTVTCPTNLAVPSLLSTLRRCLMPQLTTLGIGLWFIYQIYRLLFPERQTGRSSVYCHRNFHFCLSRPPSVCMSCVYFFVPAKSLYFNREEWTMVR